MSRKLKETVSESLADQRTRRGMMTTLAFMHILENLLTFLRGNTTQKDPVGAAFVKQSVDDGISRSAAYDLSCGDLIFG
jgi:hypothetical protein